MEIEFQTLDTATWDLAPLAPILLENVPDLLRSRLSPEFIQSILEIQTGICSSVEDVENDLMQTILLGTTQFAQFINRILVDGKDVYFGGVHAVIPGREGAGDPRRGGSVAHVMMENKELY